MLFLLEPLPRKPMVISLSSSWKLRNPETWPKNGEHSKILLDLWRIHSVTHSGKLPNYQTKTELEYCGSSWSGIYTSHSSSTSSQSKRRRVWWISGDGILVRTISSMMVHTLTDGSQLIERRTMWDIPTSIRWEETRESVWSTLIGGAETKTSESTSIWERDTRSDQLSQVSITKKSTLNLLLRIRLGLTSEQPKLLDDHYFIK